jgi:hypothetical protein
MMHWSWNNARLAMLSGSALLLFFAGSGCSNGAGAAPTEKAARAALEGALKTWRDGGKPGTLPGTEPPVVVLDTPWSQGASLASYEILGEEAGAGVEKLFTVRLSLKKPERTEEVQYHVLGVGPVMVFRDQDYLRNINMENGPRLIKPGRQPRRPRR